MFTKDVYLILMNHCTHLEILKRIFKVVFLFSYQSSVLKEPCIHQCFFKFLSLPYRGDLIIISPHPAYVNNFFQLFLIFLIFFVLQRHNIRQKPHKYWVFKILWHKKKTATTYGSCLLPVSKIFLIFPKFFLKCYNAGLYDQSDS